jgi:hypothetical protein
MSFTVSGLDGVLVFFAVLCFLAATIIAWVAAGHRLYFVLLAAAAFLVTLTRILH